MSFLTAMASCSNSRQKILIPKESDPPIREVVQGIHATSVASKKKVRKRSKHVDVAPPAQDSSKEKFSTAGVDERSLIDISLDEAETGVPNSGSDLLEQLHAQDSWLLAHGDALIGSKAKNIPLQNLACGGYAYTVDNKQKKMVELAEKLEAIKDRATIAEDHMTALNEKIDSLESELTNLQEVASGAKARESSLKKSLEIAQKKTLDVEKSSRLALDEQTSVTTYLRDQVKVLKEQVTTLEDQVVLDVTFYDGLCFDTIYNAWSANGESKSFNWLVFPRCPGSLLGCRFMQSQLLELGFDCSMSPWYIILKDSELDSSY
ncbi:hypothetical protein CsatB_019571 [Cannabis sativa]